MGMQHWNGDAAVQYKNPTVFNHPGHHAAFSSTIPTEKSHGRSWIDETREQKSFFRSVWDWLTGQDQGEYRLDSKKFRICTDRNCTNGLETDPPPQEKSYVVMRPEFEIIWSKNDRFLTRANIVFHLGRVIN